MAVPLVAGNSQECCELAAHRAHARVGGVWVDSQHVGSLEDWHALDQRQEEERPPLLVESTRVRSHGLDGLLLGMGPLRIPRRTRRSFRVELHRLASPSERATVILRHPPGNPEYPTLERRR